MIRAIVHDFCLKSLPFSLLPQCQYATLIDTTQQISQSPQLSDLGVLCASSGKRIVLFATRSGGVDPSPSSTGVIVPDFLSRITVPPILYIGRTLGADDSAGVLCPERESVVVRVRELYRLESQVDP